MTSTALALSTAKVSPDAALLSLFDFSGSQQRIEARLRSALDGNGALATDLSLVERHDAVHSIVVAAKVDVGWKWKSRQCAGRVRGEIEFVRPAAVGSTMSARCTEWARSQPVADMVQSLLEASPQAGMSLSEKVALGSVPYVVGCEEQCHNCWGSGKARCGGCTSGRRHCLTCRGSGSIQITGRNFPEACHTCGGYGEVRCSGCNGTSQVNCYTCNMSGILTTLAEGVVYAGVHYTVSTAEGADPEWTKALSEPRGHIWLLDQAAVSPPAIEVEPAWVSASWRLDVPVMRQRFEIHGKAYRTTYVGKGETVWEMPPFLDDTAGPIARQIAAAGATEAFAIAAKHPLTTAIRSGVLHGGSDEDVRQTFERAATDTFVRDVRLALSKHRDHLASDAVRRVWKWAVPVSVTAATCGIATGLFSACLRGFGYASPTSSSYPADLSMGFLALSLLFGLSFYVAGRAGLAAVRRSLDTSAKSVPHQGMSPAYAALVSLILYGAVGLAFAPNGTRPVQSTLSEDPRAAATATLLDKSRGMGEFPIVTPPAVPWASR
ncbi:hypothetical protein [uncultured Methylobacterium sp.]|uniref:hypothetical protein n=1 Tax=uncultured Methylobacterium sp. TaxID=157278 RepID=UPI0025984E4C|nr:hypothetical protein [uncultured Methylobacterium sp.]